MQVMSRDWIVEKKCFIKCKNEEEVKKTLVFLWGCPHGKYLEIEDYFLVIPYNDNSLDYNTADFDTISNML